MVTAYQHQKKSNQCCRSSLQRKSNPYSSLFARRVFFCTEAWSAHRQVQTLEKCFTLMSLLVESGRYCINQPCVYIQTKDYLLNCSLYIPCSTQVAIAVYHLTGCNSLSSYISLFSDILLLTSISLNNNIAFLNRRILKHKFSSYFNIRTG